MYAAIVYFGHGFYGLQAASCGYFGRPPDQLSWPQAAVLAGLVQAPSAYDPLDVPRLARSRAACDLQAGRDQDADQASGRQGDGRADLQPDRQRWRLPRLNRPRRPAPRTERRQILGTAIAETACHVGHLDAARELIDGQTWLILT